MNGNVANATYIGSCVFFNLRLSNFSKVIMKRSFCFANVECVGQEPSFYFINEVDGNIGSFLQFCV